MILFFFKGILLHLKVRDLSQRRRIRITLIRTLFEQVCEMSS